MSPLFRNGSENREIPMRKVSLVEPVFYEGTRPSFPEEPLIIIHLLGALRKSAERVFALLSTKHDLSRVKLKWWREFSPSFDCKQEGEGKWMGYNFEQGFHEIPQTNESDLHSVFMLYYSDGADPSQLLEDALDRGMLPTDPSNLIIPIAESVLNRRSCYHVTVSEWSPLLRVKVGLRTYCAPFTVERLGEIPTQEFYGSGRSKLKLGELGWRLK